MSSHDKFNFKSLDEIKQKAQELNVDIGFEQDICALKRPVKIGNKTAPNAIAVLPMEGCDSNADGSPSELVERRYMRFLTGGAGLIWWEACAVVHEGKANPLQMMLTDENLDKFAQLMEDVKQAAKKENGEEHEPVSILQLTHSGRYSRPNTHKNEPITLQRDPLLDERVGITDDSRIVTDEYLSTLPEKYAKSAVLAKKAGFDGVDIKCCHRYLLSELLASHTRQGMYGTSFENRTRLIVDIIRAVRKAVGDDFIIACRFNVYDAHPYPYGFGADKNDMWKFDESEPLAFVKLLCEEGVDLLSNSAGNPYYIYPQVTRPFDVSSEGIPVPEENQLESIQRLFMFTKLVQKAAGNVPVVGNGYTWLRQFAPYAGEYNVKNENCKFMGLGRSAFAYPEAPKAILNGEEMQPSKCCVTCSKCTQIMRDHGRTGCVIKDGKIYAPLFKEAREDAINRKK